MRRFVKFLIFSIVLVLLFNDLWVKHLYETHTVVELICIFIGLTAFLVVWETFEFNSLVNRYIGFGFLAVAVFDIFHTYYYQASQLYSRELSTKFWIMGRILEAVLLLLLSTRFYMVRFKNKYMGLLIFSLITMLPSALAFMYPTKLRMWHDGLTPLKIVLEYICIGLFVAAIPLLRKNKNFDTASKEFIYLAIVFGILAEISFTLYNNDLTSFFSMIGHILRLFCYFCLFKGIFTDIAVYPFKKVEDELICKEKLMEQMKELDNLRTEFFANLSHEFRTPLNVVFSALQLIEHDMGKCPVINSEDSDSDKHQKARKNFKIIRQNCYRLLRIINNLIDITKIDAGYYGLNLKNLNIVSIVEEVTLSVAQFVKTKDINLIFDTDVEEKIIAVDDEKIERVVLNLISNAIKFSNPGSDIYVNVADKGEEVEISVQDEGIGIDKMHLDTIFERFHQVDKTSTRNAEGSGIGLSLVKSIVNMHGGRISVNSEVGRGSTFKFVLPARVTDEPAETRQNIPSRNKVEAIKIEFSDIYN